MPDHYGKKAAKIPNAETRVGRGKVRMAHHGRDSMGLKMKMEERAKLLKSGAKDLVEGMRKEKLRSLPRPPKMVKKKRKTGGKSN